MTAASPAPSQLQAVPASVTDDAAFEAFASCRFQEAARLAAEELAQQKEPRRDDSQATTLKRPTKGVPLPCPLSDGFLEKKGGKTCILIELHEHCARSDKLAAILVQCAYELKQEAEESLFVQYYAAQGSIPFPVALIWLQVCLAKGGTHYNTVRRVLMQLLMALEKEEEELLQLSDQSNIEKEESQSSAPQLGEEGVRDEMEEERVAGEAVGATAVVAAVDGEKGKGEEEEEGDRAQRRRSIRGMYGQAMELLVLKVMLALGEWEAGLERVRGDKHLEGRVRQTLVDSCQAAVKRQRENTLPSGRRSSNGRREAQRGTRAQPKTKKEASASSSSSSSSAARSTVLSSPSPPSSQALTTSSNVTSQGVLASSLSSSLSGFIRSFVWGGQSQQTNALSPSTSSFSSRTASPSSSTSSSSLLSTSSSPRTLRQQLMNSSPHHILLSFLGFVALALGFHLRRGLGMGSRTLAQHAARLLQRIVQVVLLGGEKTGGH